MVVDQDINTLIFDFDGTLFHLPVDWTGLRRDLGLAADARLGDPLQRFIDQDNRAGLEIVSAYERAAVESGGFTPGARECLARLKGRRNLAVLTRNTRHSVCAALGELADGLFIVGREDVRRLKPDPDGLHMILRHYRASPGQAVLIGDTYYDVRAAAAAGLRSVIVRNPFLKYVSDRADFYIDDLIVCSTWATDA